MPKPLRILLDCTCLALSNSYLTAEDKILYRLKRQYCAANQCIGKTGAGLAIEDVIRGSKIWNIICTSFVHLTGLLLCSHKLPRGYRSRLSVVLRPSWLVATESELQRVHSHFGASAGPLGRGSRSFDDPCQLT